MTRVHAYAISTSANWQTCMPAAVHTCVNDSICMSTITTLISNGKDDLYLATVFSSRSHFYVIVSGAHLTVCSWSILCNYDECSQGRQKDFITDEEAQLDIMVYLSDCH